MNYGYKLYKMSNEGRTFWAAESLELKGCVAQGESPEEALTELEKNEKEWLCTADEYGIALPENTISETPEFSGKLTLRMPKSLHKEIAELAAQDDISINQYIINKLSFKVGWEKGYSKAVEDEKNISANARYLINDKIKVENSSLKGNLDIFKKGISYEYNYKS